MTSPLQGSKAARSEIKRFHGCLNQKNLVPRGFYRMSNWHYNLVSYTNQIIALFLSKNYYVIPLFIQRVVKIMEKIPVQTNSEGYRSVVQDYLCQMTHFLLEYSTLDKDYINRHVPEHIRAAGPRKAPDYDPQRLEFKITK